MALKLTTRPCAPPLQVPRKQGFILNAAPRAALAPPSRRPRAAYCHTRSAGAAITLTSTRASVPAAAALAAAALVAAALVVAALATTLATVALAAATLAAAALAITLAAAPAATRHGHTPSPTRP